MTAETLQIVDFESFKAFSPCGWFSLFWSGQISANNQATITSGTLISPGEKQLHMRKHVHYASTSAATGITVSKSKFFYIQSCFIEMQKNSNC